MQAQRGRTDGTHPPRPQPEHDQPRVGHGAGHSEQPSRHRQDEALGNKEPAYRRGLEAQRLQQPDFAQPLLDAEPEEQAGKKERRHDQERAEVREVLAEVSSAGGRSQALPAHVVDREPERQRVHLGPERRAISFECCRERRSGWRNDAYRGHPAMPRAPQRLAPFDGDERLGRRPVAVPVVLVCRTDASKVDRKWRIPIGKPIRVGNPRILGHEVAIGGGSGNRHDAGDPKLGGARRQASSRFPHVVLDRYRIAGGSLKIPGRPVIEKYGCGGGTPGVGRQPDRLELDRGHDRIRDFPIPGSDRIRKIGERRHGGHPGSLGRIDAGAGERVAQNRGAAFKREGSLLFEGTELHAEIVDVDDFLKPALGRCDIAAGHHDGVRAIGLLEHLLHSAERYEDGPDRTLAWA